MSKIVYLVKIWICCMGVDMEDCPLLVGVWHNASSPPPPPLTIDKPLCLCPWFGANKRGKLNFFFFIFFFYSRKSHNCSKISDVTMYQTVAWGLGYIPRNFLVFQPQTFLVSFKFKAAKRTCLQIKSVPFLSFRRVPGRRTWTHAASRKTDNVHALLVPGRMAWMIKLPQF